MAGTPRDRRRLEEVRRLLGQGKSTVTIQDELGKRWHVGARQVRSYIKAAVDELAEEDKANRPAQRARIELVLEGLIEDAREAGDFKAAVRAAEVLGRVTGAFVEETGKGDGEGLPLGFKSEAEARAFLETHSYHATFGLTTDDSVKARIAELLTKHPELIPAGLIPAATAKAKA